MKADRGIEQIRQVLLQGDNNPWSSLHVSPARRAPRRPWPKGERLANAFALKHNIEIAVNETELFSYQNASISRGGERIKIWPPSYFPSMKVWCYSLFHELAHATGKLSLLARDTFQYYFSPERNGYIEEIIADGTALCLLHALGGKTKAIGKKACYYIDAYRIRAKLEEREEIEEVLREISKAVELILA